MTRHLQQGVVRGHVKDDALIHVPDNRLRPEPVGPEIRFEDEHSVFHYCFGHAGFGLNASVISEHVNATVLLGGGLHQRDDIAGFAHITLKEDPSPPPSRIHAATCSPISAERPVTTTDAPTEANRSATLRPYTGIDKT